MKICKWCNKEFEGHNRQEYCNTDCRDQLKAHIRRIRNRSKFSHYNPEKDKYEFVCKGCGVQFDSDRYNTERCRPCYKKHKNELNEQYRESKRTAEHREYQKEYRRKKGICKPEKRCHKCDVVLVGVHNATRYCDPCRKIVEATRVKNKSNKPKSPVRTTDRAKKKYDEKVSFNTTKKNIRLKYSLKETVSTPKNKEEEMIKEFLKGKSIFDKRRKEEFSKLDHAEARVGASCGGGFYVSGHTI